MRIIPALLTLSLFTACSQAPDENSSRDLKTYRYSLRGVPVTVDTLQTNTNYALQVALNVYDTLYRYKYLARPYEITPELAEDMPTVSEDGLVYTIRIREGVHFIDDPAFPDGQGRELTADDVVYSLKRHFHRDNISTGAWLWQGKIAGLDDWGKNSSDYDAEVPGLKTLDRYTVQITLIQPYPQLVHSLAIGYAGIVPREAVEYYGREISIHPVGSGPFKLKSFDSSKAVLTRNENFLREPLNLQAEGYDPEIHQGFGLEALDGKTYPFIDQLEMHFVQENTARWNSFNKGNEIQFLEMPNEQISQISQQLQPEIVLKPEYREKYRQLGMMTPCFRHLEFNLRDPEIGYHPDPERTKRNKALRCAIRSAFNWQAHNESFFTGLGKTFPGVILPSTPEYDESIPFDSVQYNSEKASQMLAESGWNANNLPTLNYAGIANLESRQMFEQFRGFLKDIGYPSDKVQFDSYAGFGDYIRAVRQGKFSISNHAWCLDYPDSQNTLQLYYGPYEAPGSNIASFHNEEFDRLYKTSSSMLASAERTAMYQQMNQIVIEECPTIAGLSPVRLYLWHDNVIVYPDDYVVGGFHLRFVDVK